MKLIVISDLHFARNENIAIPNRVGVFADIFLLKAVHRINRYIKPDLVFIAGDLINDPTDSDAISISQELKNIIDLIEAPVIVIPGNHDLDPKSFYKIFKRPPDFVDIKGVRFLPFIDEEQPNYNAKRSQNDISKMAKLAREYSGPVVSLQHVPLFEKGTIKSHYNYVNHDEIISAMRKNCVILAVSGHDHTGSHIKGENGVYSAIAPACCVSPFQFMEIEINDKGIPTSKNHQLRLPDNLPPLTDFHIHTHLAYCGENMDMLKTLQIAKLTNLDRLSFSEHAGQLYLSSDDYWSSAYFHKGINGCNIENRMDDFFSAITNLTEKINREKITIENSPTKFLSGLELDCDINGDFTVFKKDLDKVNIRVGALHGLHMDDYNDYNAVKKEFMFRTEQIVNNNVDILAHPFRMFKRCGLPTAPELYKPIVKLLKDSNTAAEINLHTNDPDPEFLLCCIDNDVKLSFGSDSHNLYEVGELHRHLALIKSIGYLEKLDDIMFKCV